MIMVISGGHYESGVCLFCVLTTDGGTQGRKIFIPHLIPPCIQEVTRLLAIPKGNELMKERTVITTHEEMKYVLPV